jgi:uncharacterized protein YjbI with pentapeptide repeats
MRRVPALAFPGLPRTAVPGSKSGMANPEHLAILKQGVWTWNKWRAETLKTQPDLSETNLIQANLIGANLSGANLSGASLFGAELSGASFSRADLSEANLSKAELLGADFSSAKLGDANLSGAVLHVANLSRTKLEQTDFSACFLFATIFADVDLSTAKGLETVNHEGPSEIGLQTFFKSKGKIPEIFLRGCGVPEEFITYAASLVNKQFYSVFISHSSKDEVFVEKLHDDLRAKGVRCWYFKKSARLGETVWGEIDRSIYDYDKVVLVCSENSLQSAPVLRELERALQREDAEKKNVLFPIRLDDYVFDGWQHERKADVVKKVIGDFTHWKDPDAYAKGFARLLHDLKADGKV